MWLEGTSWAKLRTLVHRFDKRLPAIQFLIEQGFLTPEQVEAAKVAAPSEPTLRTLQSMGFVGEREAVMAQAQEAGHHFADLDRMRIGETTFGLIPERLMKLHSIVPVGIEKGRIILAIGNTNDVRAIDDVYAATGHRPLPVMAVPAAIDEAIRKGPQEERDDSALLGLTLIDGKARIAKVSPNGDWEFSDGTLLRGGLWLRTLHYKNDLFVAIEEFESLLNSSRTLEADFQRFFIQHPDFILGDEYREAHSHLALTRDDGDPLFPDFILRPHRADDLCDLLELKRPDMRVTVGAGERVRFSSEVHKAIAQLTEYQSYFDNPAYRLRFRQAHGLDVFRPRLFLIIGRADTTQPLALRRAEMASTTTRVLTYDDVLSRAQARVLRLGS